MLTPEKMTQLERNKVIEMYSKLNQELTSQIIKKLLKSGDISSFTKAQIRQLSKQGGNEIFYSTLKASNLLSSKQKKEIEQLYQYVINEQTKGNIVEIKGENINIKTDTSILKLVDSMYRRTNKNLKNLSKTIAFSSKKKYVEALDELYLKVSSGSMSYDKAMKNTMNELVDSGVTLKDKNGNNVKIETAVKRNLMTSLTQTANDISKQVGDVIGANCVVIGHTPYCRPSHRPIDGVIMSLEKFKEYEYLTEEANCYHIVNYDWREEFEGKDEKVKDNGHLTNAEYNKNYQERQKQNYYARQVRDKKEELSMLQKSDKRNSITQENLEKIKKELRKAQLNYRKYCIETKKDVDYSLTWKAGYNK